MGSRCVQPLVLQQHVIADRLSRTTKLSGTAGFAQQCCPVGARPDFMGLNLLYVAAVLDTWRRVPYPWGPRCSASMASFAVSSEMAGRRAGSGSRQESTRAAKAVDTRRR